jgi:hypothetical protein
MNYEWGEEVYLPVAPTEAETALKAERRCAETAARAIGLPEELVEAFPTALLKEIAAAGPGFAESPAIMAKIKAASEAAFE